MENCRKQLGRVVWTFLIILFMAPCWPMVANSAEPPAGNPAAQEEKETLPEKPPEKPPEVPRILPGATPEMPYLPYTPYNTLLPGAQTGLLAPYGSGFAQDTLRRGWQSHHLGPVRVAPYFEYDEMYRTNIFQTANDKKSDFINTINPGIRFELPVAQQHRLSMGYLGNYFIYSRFDSQTHFDHNFNADAALNFNKLSLRVGSAFRAAAEEANSQTLRQRYYYLTTPYIQAAYGLADRWRIEGNYQFNDLSFAKSIDRIDDTQDHVLGLTLFYKFWPKTSALVQYVADIQTHPFNSLQNNTIHTPYLGLSWDPTAKVNGIIKVGYSITDYTNNVPGLNSSPKTFSFSVQTNYRYSNYTTLILIAQRGIQQDVDNNNTAFINTGFTATATHFFHYFEVSSYLTLAYYNNSYVDNTFNSASGTAQKRTDNYITIGGGLSRPITRWLRLRLDYLYTDRGSDFGGLSYNEHRVLAGFQTSF